MCVGDEVLAIDGKRVGHPEISVHTAKIGSTLTFTILRRQTELDVAIVVEGRHPFFSAGFVHRWRG